MNRKSIEIFRRFSFRLILGLFLFVPAFLQSQEPVIVSSDDFEMEEGMDSLFISVQQIMSLDSSEFLLKKESTILQVLMTDYEDFYSLTKNLFLLDYDLDRKGDKKSKSILRYWMGYYMMSQNLMDNAIELWNGIDQDLPSFLLPDLYLNRGIVLSSIEEYEQAISSFQMLESIASYNDSILWRSDVELANVYQIQKRYSEEIDLWIKTINWLSETNYTHWLIISYKRLADAYRNNEDYSSSIVYLNKANELHQMYDPDSPELFQYYVDIALIFELQGDNAKSLGYLKTAGKEMRKADNYFSEAEISYRIAYIYYSSERLDQAAEYNTKAIRISSENQFEKLLLKAYYLNYEIMQKSGDFEGALSNYSKFAEINQRFAEEEKENLKGIYQKQYQIERAEKQYKLIIASEELKDFEIEQFRLEKEKSESNIILLQEQKTKKEIELQNQILLANETKNQLELSKKQFEAEQQKREIENLESEKQLKQLQIDEQNAKELANEREIENLTKDYQISALNLEKEIQKKKRVRWFSLFAVIIAILLLVFLRTKIKANRVLSEKNQEIAYQHREIEIKNKKLALEKGKTDSLLLNILPQETAEELKSTGKALPKNYNSVSILFSDFAGFTALTEKMDPKEVLANLEFLFSRFDDIAVKNEMERIKTIGDGYMCAGGLPIENTTHPINAIRTGLAFLEATKQFNEDQLNLGKIAWNLRIGINTGKVVAGVLGRQKFAYDIWGASVNLASRAESHGVLNHVNITEKTYLLIKDQFDCEYRGEVAVKNIGKVKMYIVQKEKAIV